MIPLAVVTKYYGISFSGNKIQYCTKIQWKQRYKLLFYNNTMIPRALIDILPKRNGTSVTNCYFNKIL